MLNTQLQLLKSLGITTWHRQQPAQSSPLSAAPALLVLAPGIADFMLHQQLFSNIVAALKLDDAQYQVIHNPAQVEQFAGAKLIWVIGDAGSLEGPLSADNTIYSASLKVLTSDTAAKKHLWQALKVISAG